MRARQRYRWHDGGRATVVAVLSVAAHEPTAARMAERGSETKLLSLCPPRWEAHQAVEPIQVDGSAVKGVDEFAHRR